MDKRVFHGCAQVLVGALYATLWVMTDLGLYVYDVTWFSSLTLPFLLCLAAVVRD